MNDNYNFPTSTWHTNNWVRLAAELLRVLLAALAGYTGGGIS